MSPATLRRLLPHSLDAIRELLGRANDIPYDLPAIAEEKCFGRGAGGEPLCIGAFVDDGLVALAVTAGHYLRLIAVDPDHRRRGIGSLLVRSSEEAIRLQGAPRLILAAEPGNYFTAGPLESDHETRGWLERRGFTPGTVAINLIAPLNDLPQTEQQRIVRADSAMRNRVEEFVTREFSRLWTLEISPAWNEVSPPLFVALDDAGEVIGFSAHDVNNRGLGFYGPAGVAPADRGRGTGRALLLASLRDLKERGYSSAVIPWVSSVEFYAKVAGATVAHRFVSYSRKLG
jgi:mycothiol synthase